MSDELNRSRPAALARWRPLAALACGVIALGACTADTDDTAPTTPGASTGETDAGVEADVIAFDNPDADDFNRRLVSTDDLTAAYPVAVLNVEGTGGTELIVSFEMQSHHCFGVHSEVEESPSEVTLTLESGLLPGIDPASCQYGVYPYTTAVLLSEPLGERTIAIGEEREPTPAPEPAGTGTAQQEPPEATAGDGSTTTQPTTTSGSDPLAMPSPVEEGGPTITIDDASQLVGRPIEEGVEWAIANDVEWRVLSYDGEPVAEESPFDATRISFVVDADRIVRFEWS